MRVLYPGPMETFVIDGVEIQRGAEADLTAAQFKRAAPYGVIPVDEAPPAPPPDPDPVAAEAEAVPEGAAPGRGRSGKRDE